MQPINCRGHFAVRKRGCAFLSSLHSYSLPVFFHRACIPTSPTCKSTLRLWRTANCQSTTPFSTTCRCAPQADQWVTRVHHNELPTVHSQRHASSKPTSPLLVSCAKRPACLKFESHHSAVCYHACTHPSSRCLGFQPSR